MVDSIMDEMIKVSEQLMSDEEILLTMKLAKIPFSSLYEELLAARETIKNIEKRSREEPDQQTPFHILYKELLAARREIAELKETIEILEEIISAANKRR